MQSDRSIIRLTKLYQPWSVPPPLPVNSRRNIEAAKQIITGLVRSLGAYEQPVHLSRAVALLLTPMAVDLGLVDSDDCPPYDIRPRAARERFRALLNALYGEQLTKRSCQIL